MSQEGTWFLLFNGSSPDGRGSPKFIGRTKNVSKAKSHYDMVSASQYSNGYVLIVTDYIHTHASQDTAWGNL